MIFFCAQTLYSCFLNHSKLIWDHLKEIAEPHRSQAGNKQMFDMTSAVARYPIFALEFWKPPALSRCVSLLTLIHIKARSSDVVCSRLRFV